MTTPRDIAVLNEDARNSQGDSFAQMAVLALGDFEGPGGWERHINQLGKVRFQTTQIQMNLGEYCKVWFWNVTACPDKRLEKSPVGCRTSCRLSGRVGHVTVVR
jgi:hypothetical protein